MGPDVGERLEEILYRKEIERKMAGGIFFWGVGNAPAKNIKELAKERVPIRVVFSKVKQSTSKISYRPKRVAVWRKYIDHRGNPRDLPKGVLITSNVNKGKYYALMCWSDIPLNHLFFRNKPPFDPYAYRTAANGKKVGQSQNTALLRKPSEDEAIHYVEANEKWATDSFNVDMEASLTGSYWVALEDQVENNSDNVFFNCAKDKDWADFVTHIRNGK